MLKKLVSVFKNDKAVVFKSESLTKRPYYEPYADASNNLIYNLLFADDIELLNKKSQELNSTLTNAIFDDKFDIEGLKRIVETENIESRVAVMAYNRLRENGIEVPKRIVYAVVFEVSLEQGLDVLASFSDGTLRYLNHSGSIAMVEGTMKHISHLGQLEVKTTMGEEGMSKFHPYIQSVFDASQKIVEQIGVWEEERLAPPSVGNIRFTFVCSDGLYFGQGAINLVETDAVTKPLFDASLALLTVITNGDNG